jgi:hypothetical protein
MPQELEGRESVKVSAGRRNRCRRNRKRLGKTGYSAYSSWNVSMLCVVFIIVIASIFLGNFFEAFDDARQIGKFGRGCILLVALLRTPRQWKEGV